MTAPTVFRSVSWYGDDDGPWDFVAEPPKSLRPDPITGRSSYRVTGRSRSRPPDLHFEHVTVADTFTGAAITLTTAPDHDGPAYIDQLWRDARLLAGVAQRLGRPQGTTVTEAELRRVIALLQKAGRRVTLQTIADMSGRFDRDNLRYFLRVNRRHLADYL